MEQIQNSFLRGINELWQPFFSNQNSKIINDENALYHVPFSFIVKSMLMFTNAQDMSNYL